jgi:hypothetical protein
MLSVVFLVLAPFLLLLLLLLLLVLVSLLFLPVFAAPSHAVPR